MRRKILWTKYIDPLAEDSSKLPDAADSPPNEYGDTEEHDMESVLKDMLSPIKKGRPVKLVQGDNGIFGVPELSLPSKVFKLFLGHCNFNIDEAVARIINRTIGVEVFRVASRYRFELGVGIAFESTEIRQRIQRAICGSPEQELEEILSIAQSVNENLPPEILAKVEKKIQNDGGKYWAVYVLPNGRMKLVSSNALDYDFVDKVNEFMIPISEVGGCLLISP